MSFKNFGLRHVLIGFSVVFLAVCGIYLLYLIAFRMSALPTLLGLEVGEGPLELFEKTFGLAANLLIAGVAVLLAINGLAISQRQQEIEEESRMTQASLDVAREAVERASRGLDAASAILRACTQLAEPTQEALADTYRASKLTTYEIDEEGNEFEGEQTEEGRAEEKRVSVKLLAVARERSAEILTASRRLVGLIAQHPDVAARDEALVRHFGRLFDEIVPLLGARRELDDGSDRTLEYDRLSALLPLQDISHRNVLILGHLVSSQHWKYLVDDLFGVVHDDTSMVSEDLAMDVATGRYVDLDAALRTIDAWSPKYSVHHEHEASFTIDLVAALVGAVLDLVNPYRVVEAERAKLDLLKRSDPRNPLIQPQERALEALLRHVKSAIGFGSFVFPHPPRANSPQLASLTVYETVGALWDEDGPSPEEERLDVLLYG